jgi:hypothetical protein
LHLGQNVATRRSPAAAIRSAGEACGRALDLPGIAGIDRPQLHAERLRHGLNSAELSDAGRIGGIAEDSRSHKPRRDLLKSYRRSQLSDLPHVQPSPDQWKEIKVSGDKAAPLLFGQIANGIFMVPS